MQRQIELLEDEEIRFQDDQVIVTNRRIIGNLDDSPVGKFSGLSLSEVGPPNKFNGGRHGRKGLGDTADCHWISFDSTDNYVPRTDERHA